MSIIGAIMCQSASRKFHHNGELVAGSLPSSDARQRKTDGVTAPTRRPHGMPVMRPSDDNPTNALRWIHISGLVTVAAAPISAAVRE